ncbi:MAG: hypothetical protein MUP22_12890 [Desulfobacterales bacterium]|nr:hypothetical protein [Desulfobacterales bacterium]
MKKNKKNVFLVSLLLISFALLIIGCGKKGPPIASKYEMPSPVTDLQGKLEGDTLILTWEVPKKSLGIAGFIVYKSKTAVSEPECKTCPILFERVIDIPIMEKDPSDMKNKVMTHNEVLELGFRYIYKVNPYMEGGRIGKDSNNYVITFEPGQNSGNE